MVSLHILRIGTQVFMLLSGAPCDASGVPLDAGDPPPVLPSQSRSDYYPFESRAQFEIGYFLYRKVQMSGGNIDELLQLWQAHSGDAPFADHTHLYETVDSIKLADIEWQAFAVSYTGPRPSQGPVPSWMEKEYIVWFRCPRQVLHSQLSNPDFKGEMDYAPKQTYHHGERVYQNFMSGDWAWQQAVS